MASASPDFDERRLDANNSLWWCSPRWIDMDRSLDVSSLIELCTSKNETVVEGGKH
jgi:hypothetical protein